MNRLIQSQLELLKQTLNLRDEVLHSIGDADLAYRLPGNPSLGEIILELGTAEAAYARSFRDFILRFDVEPPAGLTTTAALRDWFAVLDEDLLDSLSDLDDEDLERPIDRGGWRLPLEANFHVFREAVLIFAAKATLYLRALGKRLPKQLESWIG